MEGNNKSNLPPNNTVEKELVPSKKLVRLAYEIALTFFRACFTVSVGLVGFDRIDRNMLILYFIHVGLVGLLFFLFLFI